MILWCAYCQHYQGQTRPYDDFSITHGICQECEKKGLDVSETDLDWAKTLSSLQLKLRAAGSVENQDEAIRLIEFAISIGARPVDISMGLIAPLLYQVGKDWAGGRITVDQEHRLTKFSAAILDYLSQKITPNSIAHQKSDLVTVLLVYAPGNLHTVGTRILDLFFHSSSIKSIVALPGLSPEQIAKSTRIHLPKILGISIALPEQVPAVIKTVEAIRAIPECQSVLIALGGFAVSQGDVPAIAGATLCHDLAAFRALQAELLAATAIPT